LKKGTGIGSSPLDDYDNRDRDLDYATPLLLGETINSTEMRLETRYTVSQMVALVVRIKKISTDSDLTGQLGLIFEW
jgi:hypothetical protein